MDAGDSGKVALITGITGQDGSYLAEFLMGKGYYVHGIIRRSSSFNTGRIQHLYSNPTIHKGGRMKLHYGDLTDSSCLVKIITKVRPSEIYNLAAQSHVKVSFDLSEYTAEVDAVGTLRLLDAIRTCGLEKEVKFYQASTSELFGKVHEIPQKETTPFYPRSPYDKRAEVKVNDIVLYCGTNYSFHVENSLHTKASVTSVFCRLKRVMRYCWPISSCAKLYAYWTVVNYREAYGIFACNGILFNHESPRRGENFVTRKITRSVAKISLGLLDVVELGNLDSQRDWGHAKDYVEAMWMMLQQDVPDDFVIATGEAHSVREFVEASFQYIGTEIIWEGCGLEEVGKEKSTGIIRVKVNPEYFRPTEVDVLLGDASKAIAAFGWKPRVNFKELVHDMMAADLELMKSNPVA